MTTEWSNKYPRLCKCLDVFSTQLCSESIRPLIMGLIVLPKSYPPRLQNVAAFRDRVFKGVWKSEIRVSAWSGEGRLLGS